MNAVDECFERTHPYNDKVFKIHLLTGVSLVAALMTIIVFYPSVGFIEKLGQDPKEDVVPLSKVSLQEKFLQMIQKDKTLGNESENLQLIIVL